MTVLSERLAAIAEMLSPADVCADIGCDHCLTLINLIETGKCTRGIGSDIKRGPLERARENVEKHGLCDKIEIRLGAGLSTIMAGEADALVISGMGGNLLIDILRDGLNVAKSARQFILQPQNDATDVRKSLHRLGFAIADEKMVFKQGKYYKIIKAAIGEEEYEKEAYYLYGKILIDKKDAVLARYLRYALDENEKIAEGLAAVKSESSQKRLAELENSNNIIREVLGWL